MRVAVLTSGGPYARRVLLGLSLRGLVPDAVVIVAPLSGGGRRWKDVGNLLRRPPRTLAAGALRRGARLLEPPPADWSSFARDVRRPGPLNGEAMLDALREVAPDYLVLAGVGIVGGECLAIPARGTVNAHPALLPWVRGVGVVERSLERGFPVGVTVHYVNEGIDTGPIIRRELVPANPSDTLASLKEKAEERAAQLLADVVVAAAAGEELSALPQTAAFPYSSWPSPAETAGVAAAVRAGVAVRLYEQWASALGGTTVPGELGAHGRVPTTTTSGGDGSEPARERAGAPGA